MPEPPLLSLILPVYRVRRYLPECLDSVLAEAGPAVQVIAVDDASPDGSGDLLDALAAADQRLTVVRLDQNEGPGNARNVGLARACGSYVWFIDADDLITTGAITAISDLLDRDKPDVLVLGYQDLYPDGGTAPGPGIDLLRAAPPGRFALADAPQLLNFTMTAWSKVFRREFLSGLNEPFRSGIHEDVPVSCAALLAGRLAALDRICYSYRRSRPGSYMVTTSSAHSGIFDAYSEVFGMVGRRLAAADPGITPAVRNAVFERAIWHYSTVLQAGGSGFGPWRRGGLVPARERHAFFRRMHADFVRYRPPGYRLPGGARGAKFALVERNAYWLYELLEPVNKLRVRLRPAAG